MDTKFNQFRLGTRTLLHEYKDLSYFYSMVLNAWKGDYEDGKIDYMRFLMDWSRLSGKEIYELMNKLYSVNDPKDNDYNTLVIVDWNNVEECRSILAGLMATLCQCFNARFDPDAFNEGFDRIFHLNQSNPLVEWIKRKLSEWFILIREEKWI